MEDRSMELIRDPGKLQNHCVFLTLRAVREEWMNDL